MTTLFDSLQRKLSGEDDEAQPLAPQQQSIAAALRAKSGKATTTTGPAASTVGEQAATASAGTQLEQQGMAARLQGLGVQQAAEGQAQQAKTAQDTLASNTAVQQQNLATQGQVAAMQTSTSQAAGTQAVQFTEQQKTQLMNATADQQARQLAADKGLSLDNIWREFQSSEQDLAFRKDQAQIEQVGFLLSMRDKSYLDELNRIGTERDLSDKLNFQDESTRVALGSQMDQLLGELDWKKDFNATQREWDTRLASMNVDAAMAIANAELAQANQSQMWSGAGQVGKAGVDAYFSTKKSPTSPNDAHGDDTTNVDYTSSDTSDINSTV